MYVKKGREAQRQMKIICIEELVPHGYDRYDSFYHLWLHVLDKESVQWAATSSQER